MRWYEKVFSIKNEGEKKRIRAAGFSLSFPRGFAPNGGDFKDSERGSFFLSERTPPEILIVKLDSIGDYLLIRNFWRSVVESRKYRGARITLVLSSALKEVAPMLDSDTVSKFLFVKYKCWEKENSVARGQFNALLKSKLLARRYDAVMFPTYSRNINADIDSYLLRNIRAKEYILNVGDSNPRDFELQRLNYLYTRVVDTPKNTFEFFTNKAFFEAALGEKIDFPIHFIEPQKIPEAAGGTGDYVVINPHTQDSFRNWHPHNFARLALMLKSVGLKVFICGAPSEARKCEAVNELTGGVCKVANFDSIRGFMSLLAGAKVFVGLDSGAFHLAVSMGVPAVMISGGVAFFRFIDYPPSKKYRILVNPSTLKILRENVAEYSARGEEFSFLGSGVNAITVEEVFDAAKEMANG